MSPTKKSAEEIVQNLRDEYADEMRNPRRRGTTLERAIKNGGYTDEVEIADMRIEVLTAYRGKTVVRSIA